MESYYAGIDVDGVSTKLVLINGGAGSSFPNLSKWDGMRSHPGYPTSFPAARRSRFVDHRPALPLHGAAAAFGGGGGVVG